MWGLVHSKTSGLSCEDRLKIASFLFKRTDSVQDRTKRIYLFKWTSDSLVTLYKTRSNKSSIIYFWRMSAELLEELPGTVNISLPFLKVMTQALEEDRRSVLTMAVANCLSSILRLNPKPVTVYKIEVVVPLTVALIQSFLHCITSSATGNGDHCSDKMGQTVADLLHHLSYLQSVHGNTKKVFVSTCQLLLCPLLTLSGLLSTGDHTPFLHSAINSVIGNLFTRDHLNEYLSVIAQDTPNLCPSNGTQNYVWHLLKKLNAMYEDSGTRRCVLKGMPLLLRSMITQNRTECQLSTQKEFHMFILFLRVIGLNKYPNNGDISEGLDELLLVKKVQTVITEEFSGRIKAEEESLEDWLLVLECVNECLEIIYKENIYQVSEDQDGVQLVQLKQILTLTANYFTLCDKSVVNSWYKSLSVLSSLNHHLVEPLLSPFWRLLFCLDTRYKEGLPQVELFYHRLIKLYSKLHQLPKLVRELLNAIKELHKSGILAGQPLSLPPHVQKSLQAPLSSIPRSECLLLLELLTDTLKEHYLPLVCDGLEVQDDVCSPPKRKMRKCVEDTPTSLPLVQGYDHLIPAMNCVINVISTVLHPLPLNLFGKGGNCNELVGVVNKLIESVCLPLMEIASRKTILQGSALYLFLTISEFWYSLRAHYPNHQLLSDGMGMSLQVLWEQDSKTSPCPVYWRDVGLLYSPLNDLLLRKLSVLNLRFGLITEEDTLLFLNHLTSSLNVSMEAWDGQVLSVASSNHSTACLCLLLQNLPLISPVITSPDVWRRIASSIIHFTKTQTQSSNGVGMSPVDIAKETIDDLLVSSPYMEMRSLHTQIVSETLFQAGQMWPKTFFRVMRQHLITSSSADIGPLVDSLKEILGRTREERLPTDRETRKLTNFLGFVPCCLEIINSVPVSKSHVGHVISLVCRLSSLSIAVKEAVQCLDYSLEVLSLVLLFLCQLLQKLFNVLSTIKKNNWSTTGLNVLLPWFLEVGKMSEDCKSKELMGLALVAMEKTLMCLFLRQEYPNHFLKLFRKDSAHSENDFYHKCFIVLEHVSSSAGLCNSTSSVSDSTDQQCIFINQFNKCREYFKKRHRNTHDIVIDSREYHDPPTLLTNKCSQLEKSVVLPALSSPAADWTLLQSNLLSLLEGSPQAQFLYHRQILGGPLAARAGAQVHVHKMEFVSGWMRKFQSEEDEKGWSLLVGVSKNLSDMIKTLEELHQEEDIRGVFKTISSLEGKDDIGTGSHICSRTHSRLVWILCWLCVLESRLKQNGKMALLRCNTKIVIRTVDYVIQAADVNCCHGNSALIVVTGLRLLELLATVPKKVGLNPRTVVLLLHVFSGISQRVLSSSPVVLIAYQQLLSALVFNHSAVLDSCSSVILPAVLKCLQCSILLAQSSVECEFSQEAILCFVRLVELLSHQLWFNRNAVHCIAQYLISSEQAPLNKKLKDSIVSGLLLLFKLLNDTDKNYLLSSLEEQGRETLQNLFEKYNKFYRFKGMV